MKRIIALLLAALSLSFAMTACSKAEPVSPTNANGEVTYPQKSDVLYDRNGDSYSEKAEVKYFDEQGNTYHFVMDDETYLPSYVNDATGEAHDGLFGCFIDEDGYICFDMSDKVKRLEDSSITYVDDDGKKYYDPTLVTWDESGNIVIG